MGQNICLCKMMTTSRYFRWKNATEKPINGLQIKIFLQTFPYMFTDTTRCVENISKLLFLLDITLLYMRTMSDVRLGIKSVLYIWKLYHRYEFLHVCNITHTDIKSTWFWSQTLIVSQRAGSETCRQSKQTGPRADG